MSAIKISGLPASLVKEIRETGLDANNQPLEIQTSDGNGNPCRHCLRMVEKGESFYVLAHRPFSTIQPYAEVGPIFLHVENCEAYEDRQDTPEALTNKDVLLLRGYDHNERIVYGTGEIVPTVKVRDHAKKMLENDQVEFVHIRSTTNNCYQARIDNI